MFKNKLKPLDENELSAIKASNKKQGTYYTLKHAQDVSEIIAHLLKTQESILLKAEDFDLSTNSLYQKVNQGWQYLIDNLPEDQIAHIALLKKNYKIKILKSHKSLLLEFREGAAKIDITNTSLGEPTTATIATSDPVDTVQIKAPEEEPTKTALQANLTAWHKTVEDFVNNGGVTNDGEELLVMTDLRLMSTDIEWLNKIATPAEYHTEYDNNVLRIINHNNI